MPYALPLIEATRPNQVWCMDFKGSFECGNGERCDMFTVTDAFSRFVLHCRAIDSLGHEAVHRICNALMKKFGVPERIRTDNGTPFSSISGLGISKLSVKWMRLGIAAPNGAFQVYFGQLYLGILEGETSTFNPNGQCLPQTQIQEQQTVSG